MRLRLSKKNHPSPKVKWLSTCHKIHSKMSINQTIFPGLFLIFLLMAIIRYRGRLPLVDWRPLGRRGIYWGISVQGVKHFWNKIWTLLQTPASLGFPLFFSLWLEPKVNKAGKSECMDLLENAPCLPRRDWKGTRQRLVDIYVFRQSLSGTSGNSDAQLIGKHCAIEERELTKWWQFMSIGACTL